MSKQDTHFFNVFSLVIGILVVVAILLFALARVVAGRTQGQQVFVEQDYVDAVKERISPFVRIAVAGQDNSALAIVEKPGAQAGGSAMAVPESGTDVFTQACAACHGQGIGGAPKAGDKGAWAPRISKGKDTLYKHALEGFQGESGVMPAKGGRADIPDDLIRAAVDHMVDMSR